ncbi:MAG: hypothetical protein JWN86_3814 [Planctomycetota bacterium]|nr:hypothetical protein [Planctomycetota bacterium]
MIRFTMAVLLLGLGATPGARGDDGDAKADLARFQGRWSMVSMTKNGKMIPAKALEGRVAIITDNVFTDRQGEKIHGKGTMVLDTKTSPRSVDTAFTDGPITGKTTLAIYEFDGDTMKSCVANPGDPRPKSFESKAGTGYMLVTYKRVK